MGKKNLPLENKMQLLAGGSAFPGKETPVAEISDFLGNRQGQA